MQILSGMSRHSHRTRLDAVMVLAVTSACSHKEPAVFLDDPMTSRIFTGLSGFFHLPLAERMDQAFEDQSSVGAA
jgi:hypothetical protein